MKLAGTRGADQFGGLGTAGVTFNKPYSASTIGCIFMWLDQWLHFADLPMWH